MKKHRFTSLLILLFCMGSSQMAIAQQPDSLGLPGDNLNLYAALKLFQESETLEGFEKNLNDENSKINNLDLDGDNQVDYIRVFDNIDGEIHNIVMQVAINAKENQDVAVFTVQKDADGQVMIQLTGDEALYGSNYIIEPIYETTESGQTPNPGYIGNTIQDDGQTYEVNRTTTVEIATWPVIRYIYLPGYSIWHSPWYYGYYPSYWRPWRPYYWHYYYGYHYNYRTYYYGHYHHYNHHRNPYWKDYYYSSRRSYSPQVTVRIQSGTYRDTYSRPEQRYEGTAAYRKANPAQPARSSDRSTVGSPVRNTDSQTRTSRPVSTSTTRQTTVTRETNRKVTTTGSSDRSTSRPEARPSNTTVRQARPANSSGSSRSSGESRKTGSSDKKTGSSREARPAR